MAGSVNKVILVGNLGADPEVRTFQSGGKVCNFRIATSESWKDKNTGDRQERTEWHTIAIFSEGLAGVAEKYLRKGSKVYVEGQLRTRKWQDQGGADRYSTEVVLQGPQAVLTVLTMLDGANSGNRDGGSGGGAQGGGQSSGGGRSGGNDWGGSGGQSSGGGQRSGGSDWGGGGGANRGGFADDLDDDIPF
jgi:single-strand DNA-binding protein